MGASAPIFVNIIIMRTLDDIDLKRLFGKAKEAAKNAYCPYSNFPVGAVIIGNDYKEYIGCNVENKSYGMTICAERNAIFNAIANGCKKIEAVVIALPVPNIGPCGACRSVIDEFADGDICVAFGSEFNNLVKTTVKELYTNDFSH